MNSIILITQLCSCRAEELQEVIEVHFRSAEELYKPLSSLFFFFLFFLCLRTFLFTLKFTENINNSHPIRFLPLPYFFS